MHAKFECTRELYSVVRVHCHVVNSDSEIFLAWHSITMGNNFSFAAFLIVTQALTTITILVREFISVLLVLIVTICIESRKLSFNVQEK